MHLGGRIGHESKVPAPCVFLGELYHHFFIIILQLNHPARFDRRDVLEENGLGAGTDREGRKGKEKSISKDSLDDTKRLQQMHCYMGFFIGLASFISGMISFFVVTEIGSLGVACFSSDGDSLVIACDMSSMDGDFVCTGGFSFEIVEKAIRFGKCKSRVNGYLRCDDLRFSLVRRASNNPRGVSFEGFVTLGAVYVFTVPKESTTLVIDVMSSSLSDLQLNVVTLRCKPKIRGVEAFGNINGVGFESSLTKISKRGEVFNNDCQSRDYKNRRWRWPQSVRRHTQARLPALLSTRKPHVIILYRQVCLLPQLIQIRSTEEIEM
ncbi:hypothetical protein OSB04_001611, partial [Centaurea solstitialis]